MSTGNEIKEQDVVLRVSPMDIVASPLNPRKRFLQDRILEMAESVHRHGVIQPIKCRPVEGGLEVIWGERRWRGAKMAVAGFENAEGEVYEAQTDLKIPVLVEDLDDETVFELMMIENLIREDLSPSEEARGYAVMIGQGLSNREVASRLKVSSRRVDRRLLLLDLPEDQLARLDDGELPQWAALEALRVPKEWRGGEARKEALQLAEESGSRERAHELIEARYLRPAREGVQWDSDENLQAMEAEFGSDVLVLSYKESRELFPSGVTSLTAVTAGQKVLADEVPSLPEVHFRVDESWGDLAAKYSAPSYVACDGRMEPRLLVRKDLVAEAARSANLFSCRVEGGRFCSAADFRDLDRVALMVMSHGGRLPRGYSQGRPYVVKDAEVVGNESFFSLSESLEAEVLPLDDEGEGVQDHPLVMGVLDLSHCPFLPVEGRIGAETRRQEVGEESAAADDALREKAAQASMMVGELEMAIRSVCASGGGSLEMLMRAARFLIVAGMLGFSNNASPVNHLLEALEKPEDEEGEPILSCWEAIEERAGMESLVVCAWILYMLDQFDPEDDESLRDCPQWREVAAVYGV